MQCFVVLYNPHIRAIKYNYGILQHFADTWILPKSLSMVLIFSALKHENCCGNGKGHFALIMKINFFQNLVYTSSTCAMWICPYVLSHLFFSRTVFYSFISRRLPVVRHFGAVLFGCWQEQIGSSATPPMGFPNETVGLSSGIMERMFSFQSSLFTFPSCWLVLGALRGILNNFMCVGEPYSLRTGFPSRFCSKSCGTRTH